MYEFFIFVIFLVIGWCFIRPRTSVRPSPSGPGIGSSLSNLTCWVKKLPFKYLGWMIAAVLAYLFWEDAINFDITSTKFGKVVGKKFGSANYAYVPLAILGLIIFVKFSGKTVDKITTLALGGLAGLAIIFIFADITGLDDKVANLRHEVPCTTDDDLFGKRFFVGKKDIIVCADKSALNVVADYRVSLYFEISPAYSSKYKHLLEGVDVNNFVTILKPGTFPGSIVGSYKVMPKRSRNGPKGTEPSGFDKIGVDYVILTVIGSK